MLHSNRFDNAVLWDSNMRANLQWLGIGHATQWRDQQTHGGVWLFPKTVSTYASLLHQNGHQHKHGSAPSCMGAKWTSSGCHSITFAPLYHIEECKTKMAQYRARGPQTDCARVSFNIIWSALSSRHVQIKMVQSRAAGGQQYLTVCHSMAFFHPITWKLPEQQWGAVRWGWGACSYHIDWV